MNSHIFHILAAEKPILGDAAQCQKCHGHATVLWPVGAKLCVPLCSKCLEIEKHRLLVALGMASVG